jgi:hypothetical protein
VTFSLLTSVGGAQTYTRYLLSQAEYRALPAQAQEHYEQAIGFLNRIDYEYAHDAMRRAAEAAPDHIPVQFKLYDLTSRQARLATSRRAEDYRLVALQALQRVVDNPSATPESRVRAEREIASIRTEMENAQSQELARRTAGRNYIFAFALENMWYNALQRADAARTPAILTEPGVGNPLTRSEVVLYDQNGMMYHADGLPYQDSNGVQLNKDSLVGVTLIEEPPEGFFQGAEEAIEGSDESFSLEAQLSDFLDEGGEMSFNTGDDQTATESAGEDEGMEMMEDDEDAGRINGSLSPAVFDTEETESGENPFDF